MARRVCRRQRALGAGRRTAAGTRRDRPSRLRSQRDGQFRRLPPRNRAMGPRGLAEVKRAAAPASARSAWARRNETATTGGSRRHSRRGRRFRISRRALARWACRARRRLASRDIGRGRRSSHATPLTRKRLPPRDRAVGRRVSATSTRSQRRETPAAGARRAETTIAGRRSRRRGQRGSRFRHPPPRSRDAAGGRAARALLLFRWTQGDFTTAMAKIAWHASYGLFESTFR
jgi:hypothetical protein